jgi:hypothetical protein
MQPVLAHAQVAYSGAGDAAGAEGERMVRDLAQSSRAAIDARLAASDIRIFGGGGPGEGAARDENGNAMLANGAHEEDDESGSVEEGDEGLEGDEDEADEGSSSSEEGVLPTEVQKPAGKCDPE